MRTTLSLDDDLWDAITRFQTKKGLKIKETVNLLLRSGLESIDKSSTSKPYSGPVFDSEVAPGIDSNRMNEWADELDLEDYLK